MEIIQLKGEKVEFKLSCGADVTSIPERLYNPERHRKLQEPKKTLVGRGGLAIGSTGTFLGGPVTNGLMGGHFLSYYFYLIFFCHASPCLGNYCNFPCPGRETCIGSAHSAQLQTQSRGEDWPSGLSV